jgi:hypothetical protein
VIAGRGARAAVSAPHCGAWVAGPGWAGPARGFSDFSADLRQGQGLDAQGLDAQGLDALKP